MKKYPFEIVIQPTGKNFVDWNELWEYRELFYFFTWRDIKVKYKQTVLGFLWAVLQPLTMVLIFTFFFNRALHLPTEGNLPYPVFAFSGLLLWNLFTSGVTNAGNSMVTNAHIIKKIYFPRLIIPISSVVSALFDFVMGFCVFLVMLLIFKVNLNWIQMVYCWPLSILLGVIGTGSVGCLIAALNVKYRDFRYIIPFFLQALLFLTPIIYPIKMLNQPWIKYILAINPMYSAITCFRIPLVGEVYEPALLIISISSGIILLFASVLYFKRTEMYFADLA